MAEIKIPTTNASLVVSSLKDYGITNPYMVAAILSILWKESMIQAGRENMNYTSVARLRQVFQTKFKDKSDEYVQQFVRNPEGLANLVYGGKYGNAPNEGFKYRGGGMNGITFKSNYERYAKLSGYDILSNPDLLRDPVVSADVVAAYYADQFKKFIQKYIGVPTANDVPDMATAIRAAMKATAGWESSENGNIFKEGKAKAEAVFPQMYNFVQQIAPVIVPTLIPGQELTRTTKKKSRRRVMLFAAGGLLIAGAGVAVYNHYNQ